MSAATPALSDAEFRAFQVHIHRESGIFLSTSKRALLTGRLARRLRELKLDSFGDYFRHLTEVDTAENVRLLDCVSTNETRFFREPRQFEFLERQVLPAWAEAAARGRRSRRIRAWSAGCSSGEEPYSLAMTLLHAFPPEHGFEVEVLGTDLSTRVLARAAAACWPLEDAEEIPPHHRKRFMLRGVGEQAGRMKVGPEARGVVRLQRLNLNAREYAVGGPFDLVFCRNVLIYFDPPGKERVLQRLRDRVAPDGLLFLGHAESLGQAPGWVGVRPNVYARGTRTRVLAPAS
jgi:chemotaxis protein methyltransferase CheR